VEIALRRNLVGQLVMGDKVTLVNQCARNYGLNACFAAIGLPKSTSYYQKNKKVSYKEKYSHLPERSIPRDHLGASDVWISSHPT